MNKPFGALSASLAALSLASAAHAQVGVMYVDQTAPPGGDGTSWSRAFRSLQDALDAASRGSFISAEVRVAQGVYRPEVATPPRQVAFEFRASLASAVGLSLAGSFAGLRGPDPDARDYVGTPTILSGDARGDDRPDGTAREDNAEYVLIAIANATLASPNLYVSGFTFEGARPGGHAASAVILSARSGYVDLYHSSFRGNLRTGLSIGGDNVNVIECAFIDNHGTLGGGVRFSETIGSSRISACRFERNTATYGGAMFGGQHYVTIKRSVIVGNSATEYGGGLCSVSDVRDCLIAGNTAGALGGGMYDCYNITHCTVADNSAAWGGGMHGFGGNVVNSILVDNAATQGGDQASMAQGVLDVTHSIVQGGEGGVLLAFDARLESTQMLDADPRFVDPNGPDDNPATWSDNDYHPRLDSPGVDFGVATFSTSIDLDGTIRPLPRVPGGMARPDLGCYEYIPRCPADITRDRGVTIDDLAAFIEAFGLGGMLADLDDGSAMNLPDGGVTIDDLLYFLDRYNAGC